MIRERIGCTYIAALPCEGKLGDAGTAPAATATAAYDSWLASHLYVELDTLPCISGIEWETNCDVRRINVCSYLGVRCEENQRLFVFWVCDVRRINVCGLEEEERKRNCRAFSCPKMPWSMSGDI